MLIGKWLNRYINIGVTNELRFEEVRRIRIVNLVVLLGLCSSFYFFISNLLDQRYILAFLNTITLSAMVAMLLANYKHRYHQGIVYTGILLSINFSLSSLLYQNGMEFYLLAITAVTLTVMKKGATLKIISLANCIAFLLLFRYGKEFPSIGSVPEERRFINMTIWVLFYIIFLWDFRRQNSNYQSEIETKNTQLEGQQTRLLDQTRLLEENNRKLQVLNSTKEKLFSIVAHDVRSPLLGLKGSLDLVNQQILSGKEFIGISQELSLRLEQLQNSLDNLLQWSNSQMKGIEIKKEKIPIEPLVTETLDLLNYNIINKHIKVCLDSSPDTIIDADPDHIKLVLRNLINNAIKFSYSGGQIDLLVKKQGRFVHFSVTDNGIGMKEEKVQALFKQEHFFSTRGTYNEKGTGMGLVLCKEFAEKNGGDIYVQSEYGTGTTFTFTIPAALLS